MEVYIGNVVINKRMLVCCLLSSFLCLWTFVISWSHNQEKMLASCGSPATFQDPGRWTHSLAAVCSPCYLSDCCKRCITVHGKHCTRSLLGKGQATTDSDPEPKCQVDGIRGVREKRWSLLSPFRLFQVSQDSIITTKMKVVCWYSEELAIKFKAILISSWLAA